MTDADADADERPVTLTFIEIKGHTAVKGPSPFSTHDPARGER